jgi:hypothetical protein
VSCDNLFGWTSGVGIPNNINDFGSWQGLPAKITADVAIFSTSNILPANSAPCGRRLRPARFLFIDALGRLDKATLSNQGSPLGSQIIPQPIMAACDGSALESGQACSEKERVRVLQEADIVIATDPLQLRETLRKINWQGDFQQVVWSIT